MSKADEMFEELGYDYCIETDLLGYDKEYYINKNLKQIVFYHKCKQIACMQYYDGFEYMTIQELQAINEKVKELGWLDE